MAHADFWWGSEAVKAIEGVFVHAETIVAAFTMIVFGLGMGVTMIMLPAGVVIGLLGVAVFVGGLFGRINEQRHT